MLHFGTPLVLSAQDSPQQPENLKLFSHEAGFVTKFSQTESYTSLLHCLLLVGARPCKVFCNKSLQPFHLYRVFSLRLVMSVHDGLQEIVTPCDT